LFQFQEEANIKILHTNLSFNEQFKSSNPEEPLLLHSLFNTSQTSNTQLKLEAVPSKANLINNAKTMSTELNIQTLKSSEVQNDLIVEEEENLYFASDEEEKCVLGVSSSNKEIKRSASESRS